MPDNDQPTNHNALQNRIDKISPNNSVNTVEGNIALFGTILSKIVGFFTRTGTPQHINAQHLRVEELQKKVPKGNPSVEEVMKMTVDTSDKLGNLRGTTKSYEQLIAEMKSAPKQKSNRKRKGRVVAVQQKYFDKNAPENLRQLMDLAKKYKENNQVLTKVLEGVAHLDNHFARRVEDYSVKMKQANDKKRRAENKKKERGREL